MGNRILYNQTEVYLEIQRLFRAPSVRRVAITAFVGAGAESYLPNPANITLVCWPKAGGTNPDALRKLMAKNVQVWFSDGLHMKVYWAEGRGCVISSANLSTNALGSGNLKEVGVSLPADAIDIDLLLKSIQKRRPNNAEMKRLDRDHAKFSAINKFGRDSSLPTFVDWFHEPMRKNWKLGWFDSHTSMSRAAKAKAKAEFGVSEPCNSLIARLNDYSREGGEWILTFNLANDKPTEISWMCSNFVVRVSPNDKSTYEMEFPCEAVQLWPISRYPGRPFRIDKPFKLAFQAAIAKFRAGKIRRAKNANSPSGLVGIIMSEFKKRK